MNDHHRPRSSGLAEVVLGMADVGIEPKATNAAPYTNDWNALEEDAYGEEDSMMPALKHQTRGVRQLVDLAFRSVIGVPKL